MIMKRQTDREAEMNNFFAGLEDKYCQSNKSNSKKRKISKSKKWIIAVQRDNPLFNFFIYLFLPLELSLKLRVCEFWSMCDKLLWNVENLVRKCTSIPACSSEAWVGVYWCRGTIVISVVFAKLTISSYCTVDYLQFINRSLFLLCPKTLKLKKKIPAFYSCWCWTLVKIFFVAKVSIGKRKDRYDKPTESNKSEIITVFCWPLVY